MIMTFWGQQECVRGMDLMQLARESKPIDFISCMTFGDFVVEPPKVAGLNHQPLGRDF